MNKRIYLDNNATTPLDPRVLEAMMPFFTDLYGNASSNHPFGKEINTQVNKARETISDLLCAKPSEIVFTSGATEAINMALKGVAEANNDKGRHIVTASTEHPAVLDTCKYLEQRGYEVTYMPVQSDGLLNLETVKQSIRPDTILVCVMMVNNETGVIQPIKQISEIAHAKDAIFMSDATQAVGKMPVDVDELGIDLMAFSGHKFYGPKGIGGLYIRNSGENNVKVGALLHGGGHEKGFRSGTLNVPGIIGLGKAADIAQSEMEVDASKVGKLRDQIEGELLKIDNTFLNGNSQKRLYNVTNICFQGNDADAIMLGLKDVVISNGSACSSALLEPSHVLISMGLDEEDAYSSLRFSLGKYSVSHEMEEVVYKLNQFVAITN